MGVDEIVVGELGGAWCHVISGVRLSPFRVARSLKTAARVRHCAVIARFLGGDILGARTADDDAANNRRGEARYAAASFGEMGRRPLFVEQLRRLFIRHRGAYE